MAGVRHGFLTRSEQLSGMIKKINLPVVVKISVCHTFLRLASHNQEILDELKILSVSNAELLLYSLISNQTINFKREII